MGRKQRSPLQVACERRNPDLDPQLVWRGKDMQDRSELTVEAPPLFIQEKVHPKALIDDLARRSRRTAYPPCGASFDFILDNFSFVTAVREALTASGECAEIDWSLFGLAMPAWVLLALLALTA